MNKEIAVNRIEANDYNPNEMTETEYAECKKEIKHLKRIPKPIVVRRAAKGEKFIIIDGEHNWKAAKELGFSMLPCEVLSIEPPEAMRQTYKRNQHGTFNKIKLGKMFERIMKENNLSLRKLAREYDISDGTVRNTLLYLKAKKARNSYAFENLTIRQIRIYTELPPIIKDKWLDADADVLLLFTKNEVKWIEDYLCEKMQASHFEDAMKVYINYAQQEGSFFDKYHILYKSGLADKIKATPEGFQKSIKEIEDFCSWEHWKLAAGFQPRPMKKEELRKYTIHYYGSPHHIRENFEQLFKLIYFEAKFQISPEEFEAILNDSKKYGCKPGRTFLYPQYEYMRDSIQAILLKKGILNDAVDVKSLPNPTEEIARLKFEKNAPDYFKNSKLPIGIKIGLLDYKPEDVDQTILDELKENLVKSHGDDKWANMKDILAELDELIAANQVNKEYESKTIEDLSLKIIKFSGLYKDDKKKQLEFNANLQRLTKEELHRIEDRMGYFEWASTLRNAIGTREAKREDYWLRKIMGIKE